MIARDHYWKPHFIVGSAEPEQVELIPKLGGFPWGVPLDRWPRCEECGAAMSHLAQLPHDPPMLDFGEDDSVLHIFECNDDPGMCDTWDYKKGANSCLILAKGELSEGLTRHPEKPPVIGEFRITGWDRAETPDLILENADSFYDGENYDALSYEEVINPMHDEMFDNSTKMGGIPYWTGHGAYGYPPEPFEYIGQFSESIKCAGPMPSANESGSTVRHNYANPDGSSTSEVPTVEKETAPSFLQQSKGKDYFYGQWAILGSDGTCFLYINRTVSPSEIVWFWNR